MALSHELKKAVGTKNPVSVDIRRQPEAWTMASVESMDHHDSEMKNFFHAFRQLKRERMPSKDELHFFLESDMWSAIIVFLVLFDAAISPFRSEVLAVDIMGILITLFFFTEVSTRLYVWRYVKGEYLSFFFLLYPTEE